MAKTTTRVIYEWDYETVDEHGDIQDHNHSDNFPGLPTEPNVKLVLVRDEWDGVSKDFNATASLKHRSWAYVENGKLPTEFDDGTPVPKKFFKHLPPIVK